MLAPVLAAGMALAVAACDDPEARKAEFMEKGKALYEQQDYARARVEFRNVLQMDPKNAQGLYYLGLIREAEGNYETAYTRFRAAADADPQHVEARLKIARYLLLGGEIGQAADMRDEIRALAPEGTEESTDLKVLSGAIALRQGDTEAAEAQARAVLRREANHPEATAVLTGALAARERYDDALDQVDAALAAHPDDTGLSTLKIRLLAAAGRMEDVERVYRDLIRRNPQDFARRAELAQFLVAQDRLQETAELLRAAIAEDVGGPRPRLLLVDLIARTDGAEAAIEELKAGIAEEPEVTAYRFELATAQFRQGRPEAAMDTLQALVARQPDAPEAYEARSAIARLQLAQGDEAAARETIRTVLDFDKENPEARLLRGMLRLRDGQPADAVADLRTVLRADPDSVEALRLLARAHLAQGDVPLAVQTLNSLVEAAPQDTQALAQLAVLQDRQGSPQTALGTLDRALGIDPDSPDLLNAKATLATRERRWNDAEAAIADLAALPDQKRVADLMLARLYQAQGANAKAFETFEAVRREADRPMPVAVAGATRALLAADEPARALDYVQALLDERPEDVFLLSLKADVLLNAERHAEAAEAYAAAAERAPDRPGAFLGLAAAHRGAGDPEAAIAALRRGLETNPGAPDLLARLGSDLSAQGRPEESLTVFDELVDRRPDSLVAVNNWASLLSALRPDDTEALQRARELLEPFERSSNPLVLDTVGAVLFRLGEPRQAQAFLERAIAIDPDLAEAHYHLGMTFHELGDRDAAIRHLDRAVSAPRDFLGREEARAILAEAQQAAQQSAQPQQADGQDTPPTQ
jgi:tetratricopeptide (TPR) repeat protein